MVTKDISSNVVACGDTPACSVPLHHTVSTLGSGFAVKVYLNRTGWEYCESSNSRLVGILR